ncbi:hypothetical protein [Desulfobacter sp.]|uniref:hypothetical protein n=1 Tax=Desulfobacter sp. TaxID=2294 RepID=UPI003D0F8EBF
MNTAELTHLINQRLDLLEARIMARPLGGDTVSLRCFLDQVVQDCGEFKSLLDLLDDGPQIGGMPYLCRSDYPETSTAPIRRINRGF